VKKVRAILFDLDGTLLDSAPDLVAALNWVRASEGLSPLDVRPMSRHVSRGAMGLIQAGMPAAGPEQMDIWKSRLLSRYSEHSFRQSRLYEGVPEVLGFLESACIPWGIVTNKSEALTQPILQALNLSDKAACVVCGDTLDRNKPDPAPVKYACNILQIPEGNTLFAGDDMRDLQAGRAAGTMTAVIHYGYGDHDLLDELVSGSEQIHHPSDILLLLK
jgi:N-acetyl-D-muramate 6-phosphate phosphatase